MEIQHVVSEESFRGDYVSCMMVNSCVLRDLKAGHFSSTLEVRLLIFLGSYRNVGVDGSRYASPRCQDIYLEQQRVHGLLRCEAREHKEELQKRHYAQQDCEGRVHGCFQGRDEITKKLEKIQKAIEGSVDGLELMGRFLDEFDMLQRRSQAVNLDMVYVKVSKLIPGLGFVPEDADGLVASFSGGWQMIMSLRNIQLWNTAWEKQQKETESTKDLIARLDVGENFGRVQLSKRLAVSKIYGYIFKAAFGGARFLVAGVMTSPFSSGLQEIEELNK
ncbi:hypothetical protein YC2023_052119 [Brassica napus]|uniref:(rape) hypothetical protein n=1 Tax=Brassica napus TaxID=3708 RepID=A0A816JHN2_BRANA|nr:unnamed protein product [Brassica napus]